MKLSSKTTEELYRVIYDSIVDLRIKLKLQPKEDVSLAQLGYQIWDKQKNILKIK